MGIDYGIDLQCAWGGTGMSFLLFLFCRKNYLRGKGTNFALFVQIFSVFFLLGQELVNKVGNVCELYAIATVQILVNQCGDVFHRYGLFFGCT